jgi:hypothetical protein
MSNPTEYRADALQAFSQVVGPYLRKKMGHDIATLLTTITRETSLAESTSAKDAFSQLCNRLLEIRLGKYDVPFVNLVLGREELSSLQEAFSRDYDSRYGHNQSHLTIGTVFDILLAPDLVDVLGEELVTYLKQLYINEIETLVGVADHLRFATAMEKLSETMPLLQEAEYTERIKGISEILKKQHTDSVENPDAVFSSITLQDGINQIIIPDLAAILGKGPILDALVEEAGKQCSGIFPDELARFSKFVKILNKSDIILNMFGDHWISDKEREWIKEFRELLI